MLFNKLNLKYTSGNKTKYKMQHERNLEILEVKTRNINQNKQKIKKKMNVKEK